MQHLAPVVGAGSGVGNSDSGEIVGLRGGVSGVPLQISAKLRVMKERMTATSRAAFEV